MTAKSQYDPRLVLGLRWLARLWAAALLLFWGAFFVEHTTEWFVDPHDWPPMEVSLWIWGITIAGAIAMFCAEEGLKWLMRRSSGHAMIDARV